MTKRIPRDEIPAGVAHDEPPNGEPETRRRFLWTAWIGLVGVAMAESVWIVSRILRPRSDPGISEGDLITIAGQVERFAPGSVTAFPEGAYYLVRLEDGGFLAVSRVCTHLGCTVPWVEKEQRFVCPCHASAFDLKGEVVNPPAPRPLDLYEVRIENRVVKVNLGNTSRRSAFRAEQVTRA